LRAASSKAGVRISVRIRFSAWLASGYAHVFVRLFAVIVTLPSDNGMHKSLRKQYKNSGKGTM